MFRATGRQHIRAEHGRLAGAQNPGLLEADVLEVGAKKRGMILCDRDDHRDITIDDVDCVQTPTQANFQNRELRLLLSDQP